MKVEIHHKQDALYPEYKTVRLGENMTDQKRRIEDRTLPGQPLDWTESEDAAWLEMAAQAREGGFASQERVDALVSRLANDEGKDATQARAAAPATDLHNAIMNLPCKRADHEFMNAEHRMLYKNGHRDARHAAAELALAHPAAAVEPVAIPAGFVLVPVEPTEAMRAAYICHSQLDDSGRLCPVGYKAAIAAAPSPAAEDAAKGEIPAILFDGFAVYAELTRHLGKQHCFSPDAVSATLDAVVRLMRKEGAEQQAAPEQAEKPVARLHEEISDRPFSEGKSYFEITILDRKRCFDGMELYASPAGKAAAEPTEIDKVMAAIQHACGALPLGYEVVLEMENGAGGVVWTDDEGERHVIDGEGYITDDIYEAVEKAIAHAANQAASSAASQAKGGEDA